MAGERGHDNHPTNHTTDQCEVNRNHPIVNQSLPPIQQEMGDLDGVTCFCELAVPLASRLCERLGLATNSPQAVDAARDKVGGRVGCGGYGTRWVSGLWGRDVRIEWACPPLLNPLPHP